MNMTNPLAQYAGKKLAILGASYLQLPLVQRANALGIETICIAWDDGAVCKEYCSTFIPLSILEKELILDSLLELNIDGITTIASDIGIPTVAHVAQALNLSSDSMQVAQRSTNKFLMREALGKSNLPIPSYTLISQTTPLTDLHDISTPVIVKPVDRSGSKGVSKVDTPDHLHPAIIEAQEASLSGDVIVEEFIEGVEVSVEIISWQGQHSLLAITDKETSGAPYFVETAHHQPSQLPDGIQQKIISLCFQSLDALGITLGASHSECMITDNGEVYITEIASRMGGDFIGSSLVSLSTGYDFLKGVIDCALGTFSPPSEVSTAHCSGVYFHSALCPHLSVYIDKHAEIDECVEASFTGPIADHITQSSERSGYFIYQSPEKFILDSTFGESC